MGETRRPLNLESAKEGKELSEQQQKVFTILTSLVQPDGGLEPIDGASQVDDLVPNQNEKEAEDFFWSFWTYLIKIVQLVPHDHKGQEQLVQLLGYLLNVPRRTVVIWGAETNLWKDFPLLGPVMREKWQPPKVNNGSVDKEEVEKWINLNSFAAKLRSMGYTNWHNFPTWELRAALEEEIKDQAILEFKLAVAEEWIVHAGQALYIHVTMEPADEESTTMKPGPLYNGKAKLDLERWGFWKNRLTDLAKEGSGEIATRSAAVVEKIDTIESKAFQPSHSRFASRAPSQATSPM